MSLTLYVNNHADKISYLYVLHDIDGWLHSPDGDYVYSASNPFEGEPLYSVQEGLNYPVDDFDLSVEEEIDRMNKKNCFPAVHVEWIDDGLASF